MVPFLLEVFKMSYTLGALGATGGARYITFDDFFDKIWEKTIGRIGDIPYVGSYIEFPLNIGQEYLKDYLKTKISQSMNISGGIDPKSAKNALNTDSVSKWCVDEFFDKVIHGGATGQDLLEGLIEAIAGGLGYEEYDYDPSDPPQWSVVAENLIRKEFTKLLSNTIESVLDDYINVTEEPPVHDGMGGDEPDYSGFHFNRPGSHAAQAFTIRDESITALTAAPASGSSNMMLIIGGVGAFALLKYLKVF
jgi:hypothetical protein